MTKTFTRTFWLVYGAASGSPRYVDCAGGTRSGKTFAILQYLILLAKGDVRATITSVVSETLPHLKRGAIRDFKTILGSEFDDASWSASELVYTFPTGSIIEFFSADQPGKVHGPARDRLFINEAQNVGWETARHLFVRTRGGIFLDYNPVRPFWVHDKIQPRPDCRSFTTTYKDNRFLSPLQVAEIEANRGDARWWRVYGEGKVGDVQGLIYPDFRQIDRIPDETLPSCYGLDFGFTNDPTAIVHLWADTGRKVLYVDEVAYRTRMLNADIAKALLNAGAGDGTEVFADCAEPKSIAEIHGAGVNVKPSDKTAPTTGDRLLFQLQWMEGWSLRVTKRSVDVIKELRNYAWLTDTDGNPTNRPMDEWNHAMDAMRYGAWTKWASRPGYGNYNVSVVERGARPSRFRPDGSEI